MLFCALYNRKGLFKNYEALLMERNFEWLIGGWNALEDFGPLTERIEYRYNILDESINGMML